MQIKTCGKCKIDKGVEYFSRRAASEDGLQMYCKQCMINFKNSARRANVEEQMLRNAIRQQKTKGECKQNSLQGRKRARNAG